MANKVVRLLGNDYNIVCDESDEYVQKVGYYVDKKLNEVASRNGQLPTNMLAILAAINIADDYIKEKSKGEEYLAQISEYSKIISRNKVVLQDNKMKIDNLNNEIQRLKIEIAKLEMKGN